MVVERVVCDLRAAIDGVKQGVMAFHSKTVNLDADDRHSKSRVNGRKHTLNRDVLLTGALRAIPVFIRQRTRPNSRRRGSRYTGDGAQIESDGER